MHIEPIPARTLPAGWTIRPHRHEHLCHLLLVERGGGRYRADAATLLFRAPAVLVVPLHVVHGFAFAEATDGFVLTLSESFLAGTLSAGTDPEVTGILTVPAACEIEATDPVWTALRAGFAAIGQESGRPAPGRVSAVAAHVTLILVHLLRLGRDSDGRAAAPSADAVLVDRLRDLIERRYREHWPVEAYATALGASTGRLTQACRRVAGASPLHLIHARLLLEARRCLLYTAMTVAEVGYALGFEDPAYFSRFFTKREGVTPQAYRRRSVGA